MPTPVTRLRRFVRRHASVETVLLLIVGALTAHQLFIPPIVGLADNGDYTRVMHPVGLAHVGESYEDTVFLWVQPRYRVVPPDTSLFLPSAELLLAGVARVLDTALSRDGLLDLRILGAVHLACYLGVIWLLLRAVRSLPLPSRAVVWIGVVLATPDVVNVAYLNSFYSEPASLILMLALVGVGLAWVRADAPSGAVTWAYFICAALFVSTKPQNYALALPLAGLPLALLACSSWRTAGRAIVPLALGLLALATLLFVVLPDSLRYPARWNGVFYGLLIESPSPADDLAELGLDPELARWAGVPAIEVDGRSIEAPIMATGGRFGFRQIAMFYLRHPDRLLRIADLCAEHGLTQRERQLGNYTRASGNPATTLAPSYTGWSDAKQQLLPARLWFLAAFFGGFLGVSLRELRRGLHTRAGRTALLTATLAAMAIMAFGIVTMASGIEDAATDLFMFRTLFDICLLAALGWVATRFSRVLPRIDGRAPHAPNRAGSPVDGR